MLVSAALLGVCWFCIRALDQWSKQQSGHALGTASERVTERRGNALGGSIWAGVRLALSSPYLWGICAYLFLLTTTATFLYLEQTKLVGEQVVSAEGRTRLFAVVDLAVNVLSFLAQLFMTGPMINRFGLAAALVLLPATSVVGFAVVGTAPVLTAFILFSIVRRIGEYAVAKPAREVLFTVLNREEKYKAKNFIDTAVSRAGDAATGWTVKAVKAIGIEATHIAWTLIPVSLVWAGLGWWLARQEERKRLEQPDT
jgi:AAA family ATP:ADP antiporter